MSRLPIPREHGAWAMLFVPFVVGVASVSSFEWRIIPFLIGMTAAFFAHEPLVTVIRLDPGKQANREKRQSLIFWLMIYVAIAGLCIVPIIVYYKLWYLLVLSGVTALLLLLHGYLVSEFTQRSFTAEFLGVLCLTSSSLAARYVSLTRVDQTAFLLWGLNILYFSSSIFYVKMRVSRYAKKAEAHNLTLQCAFYHLFLVGGLILLVWWRICPLLAALAFAPIVIRALVAMLIPQGKLSLKRIGLAEVAYSLVFVALLSWGIHPA